MTDSFEAPIVAVTVFPDRARVTRSGKVSLRAGEQQVTCGPLPLGLLHDSIRVTGRGPATVLGVDVSYRRAAETSDEVVLALESEIREIDAALGAADDADQVAVDRLAFLDRLAVRTAKELAGDLERVTGFADGLDAQRAAVLRGRRERTVLREDLHKRRAAAERRLGDVRGQSQPDRLVAVVTLAADEAADAELDLSYVVHGASWSSSYDLRLAGDRLGLSWFGLVSQHTGEDWPECELKLSTARPSGTLVVPELDPWYVGVARPMVLAASADMYGGAPGGGPVPAPAAAPRAAMAKLASAPMREAVAQVEDGPVAATYTPQRPVAVPADGTSHRTLIGTFELDTKIDHVTAPVRAEEAVMRATVRNSTSHTLPPGRAGLFHEGDFIGSTNLDPWAPNEERELALGVDDRVRVERELTKRTATKATLGMNRRTETEYEIRVANHSGRPIDVTVLDQVPVSREAAVTVKETTARPEPAERSELGVVTWKLHLEPQAEGKIAFGIRVEAAKGVDISGWRD
ncbi:DUF4139 domain-containing protein [Hamadaea tsunoensis]|uniref:DUF4139 domain-containing protein n=1 Tax=Hamadaea tsunoensis TaxID=53368 RepID=UPI000411EE6A|nr:DUF4139 domain-containing protein [Hamadaea tsunoensis]